MGHSLTLGFRPLINKQYPLSSCVISLHAVGSFRMALRLNLAYHEPLENRRLSLLNTGSVGHLSCGLVGSCMDSCFHPVPGPAAHTGLTPGQEGQPVFFLHPAQRWSSASRTVRTPVASPLPCSHNLLTVQGGISWKGGKDLWTKKECWNGCGAEFRLSRSHNNPPSCSRPFT